MGKTMLVLTGLILTVAGCSGPQVARRPGETALIERIPDRRPAFADWSQSYREEKDKLLFVGAVRDRSDYALSIREAGIEATKVAGEQLARELNSSLRSSVVGQNVADDLGRTIQDLFVQETRGLSLTGLVQRERYAEKFAVGTVSGQTQTYSAWALLEIPKSDYVVAKQNVLDRAAGRAREARNIQAERLLEAFRAEVKGATDTARQP